jgi:hypothetical protein
VFYTRRGQLTAYALACGYLERRGAFTLWREHGVYHVRGFGHDGARHWQSGQSLTWGRRMLRQLYQIHGTANRHAEAALAARPWA